MNARLQASCGDALCPREFGLYACAPDHQNLITLAISRFRLPSILRSRRTSRKHETLARSRRFGKQTAQRRLIMRKFVLLAATAALLVVSSEAMSAAARFSPGHQFRLHGPVAGTHGASGYTPGHLMRRFGSVRGHPGASGYAPGHR